MLQRWMGASKEMCRNTRRKGQSGKGRGIVRAAEQDTGAAVQATVGKSAECPRVHIAIPVRMGIVVVICSLVVAVGCSLVPRPQPTPQRTATPWSTSTLRPTWPPTWTPAFTPWPEPTSTPDPTPIPALSVTPMPVPLPTRARVVTPLTIDFGLNNKWCLSGDSYVPEFTIWAQGGDGKYTYYRDIDLIGGPTEGEVTYQVTWTACGGAPGTFFVRSGDGQEASKEFWIRPPGCCRN